MVDIGHIASRVQSPLTNLVTSSATDFSVVSTSGFVAPCAILIGHEDAWHDPLVTYVPELVWITTVVDGTTLRCTLADRGISGTAVRSHDGTAGDLVVTQVLDQRNWERLRDELDAIATRQASYTVSTNPSNLPEGTSWVMDEGSGWMLWSVKTVRATGVVRAMQLRAGTIAGGFQARHAVENTVWSAWSSIA